MLLDIVSKTKPIYSGTCEKITLTTISGEITVLNGHQNLVSALDIGKIRYVTPQGEQVLFSDGGFVEVSTVKGDTKITVLANRAHVPSELFKEEVDKAIKAAEEEMKIKKSSVSETALIQLEKKLRFEKFLKEQTGL